MNETFAIIYLLMEGLDNDFQDNESTEFPAFPVVFQPQEESREQAGPARGFKLPEGEISELERLIEVKHDTIYPELFKESWKDSTVDSFFAVYRPLNREFVAEMEALKDRLHIVRVSSHKLYVGEFLEGRCEGRSIVVCKNGNAYEGVMRENRREGRGTYVQGGVGWFEGVFANDLKTQVGVEVVYRKWAYRGGFLNGLRHERGLFVEREAAYLGQWKLGIMHGKGVLRTGASVFEGTLVNSLKHGSGEERFGNGDVYRGDYQNNRFDGFGSYSWRGGASYEGSFRNGLRHGKGKWAAGETKYSGSYAEGLKEGYGELYFPSGNFYKGNFVEDKREGYGEMFWTDGSFYKGEWKGGVQNGKGQIYLVGGEVVSGLFENSILVQLTPSIYEKQMEISSMGIHDLFGSNPHLQQPAKTRTLSEAKQLPTKRKLAKIEEGPKKKQAIKDNIYFRSPERNAPPLPHHSSTHHESAHPHASTVHTGFPSFTNPRTPSHSHHHGHSHGKSGDSHECKCLKRLENFRLRQRVKTKINESKVLEQGQPEEA